MMTEMRHRVSSTTFRGVVEKVISDINQFTRVFIKSTHKHIMNSQDDATAVLPVEIMLKIFSYVESEDVFTLRGVNKRWRMLCSSFTVKNEIRLIEIKESTDINERVNNFICLITKFNSIKSLSLRGFIQLLYKGMEKILMVKNLVRFLLHRI